MSKAPTLVVPHEAQSRVWGPAGPCCDRSATGLEIGVGCACLLPCRPRLAAESRSSRPKPTRQDRAPKTPSKIESRSGLGEEDSTPDSAIRSRTRRRAPTCLIPRCRPAGLAAELLCRLSTGRRAFLEPITAEIRRCWIRVAVKSPEGLSSIPSPNSDFHPSVPPRNGGLPTMNSASGHRASGVRRVGKVEHGVHVRERVERL